MPRDLRIDAAQGIIVVRWKTAADGLFLRVRGQADDVRLVCRCGRSHWVVREQFMGGGASLVVRCHHCGSIGSFVLEGVRLPTP